MARASFRDLVLGGIVEEGGLRFLFSGAAGLFGGGTGAPVGGDCKGRAFGMAVVAAARGLDLDGRFGGSNVGNGENSLNRTGWHVGRN